MERFIALDFETANYDYSSICQIGMVFFENGKITKSINQLIDPEDYFDGYHISIHGIRPEDIEGKPTFAEYYPKFFKLIDNHIILHHQPFDRSAFEQACAKYSLEPPYCFWLDNAKIVRRTWLDRSRKGYGLKEVAQMLNFSFNHHDAVEDARVTGLIFLEACKCKGMDIDGMITNVYDSGITETPKTHPQRITGNLLKPDTENVENKDNPFFGKKVVISGTYNIWPDRKDLAMLLKNLGADIDSGVTERTNILIAGEGVGPSKLNKMIANINEGRNAIILQEKDVIEKLKGILY